MGVEIQYEKSHFSQQVEKFSPRPRKVQPVSYTHLDVYKRQVYNKSNEIVHTQ